MTYLDGPRIELAYDDLDIYPKKSVLAFYDVGDTSRSGQRFMSKCRQYCT